MPYESKKQERFFEACRHGFNPSRKGVSCPPKKVTEEYRRAEVVRGRGKKRA